jgi:hypothetical protein
MSNIAIQGAATGTGVFTLASPATNTDRTLVLPDEAGTVLTSAGSLPAGNLTGSVPASAMPVGSVLQIAKGESTTQVSFTTLYTYYTLYSFNVTAVGDNSRYVFNTYQHAYHNTSSFSSRANLGYSVTIGGTTTRLAGVDGTLSGDSWGPVAYPGAVFNRHHVWDSSVPAGTVITVNVLGATYDAGTIYFNYAGYSMKGLCTVTEVSV